MAADSVRRNVVLGIADLPGEPLQGDAWIGAFLALGSRLRSFRPSLVGRQLVVALSVPRRDYVAALVGAGWMLSSPAPLLKEPMELFRAAPRGAFLRAVTDSFVDSGIFTKLDDQRPDPRVTTGGRTRATAYYKAVAILDAECENVSTGVPDPGFLGEWIGVSETWLQRVAAPSTDLVLVGTRKWLLEDLEACIGNAGVEGAQGAPLANYVLPIDGKAATWATKIIPAARLAEGENLPSECAIVILDRYGAIKYLDEMEVPIVVCIVDRSVADDSSAELIVQARLSNSRPISSESDLRWNPPIGVEAMAFTVAI